MSLQMRRCMLHLRPSWSTFSSYSKLRSSSARCCVHVSSICGARSTGNSLSRAQAQRTCWSHQPGHQARDCQSALFSLTRVLRSSPRCSASPLMSSPADVLQRRLWKKKRVMTPCHTYTHPLHFLVVGASPVRLCIPCLCKHDSKDLRLVATS